MRRIATLFLSADFRRFTQIFKTFLSADYADFRGFFWMLYEGTEKFPSGGGVPEGRGGLVDKPRERLCRDPSRVETIPSIVS
jgi:hypothetical protein